MRWLDSIIYSLDMNLSKLRETVKERGVCPAAVHGIAKLDMTYRLNNSSHLRVEGVVKRRRLSTGPHFSDDPAKSPKIWPFSFSPGNTFSCFKKNLTTPLTVHTFAWLPISSPLCRGWPPTICHLINTSAFNNTQVTSSLTLLKIGLTPSFFIPHCTIFKLGRQPGMYMQKRVTCVSALVCTVHRVGGSCGSVSRPSLSEMSEVELGAHVPSSEKIKRSSKSVVRACVYGSWLGGQVCMTSWFPTKRLFILWACCKHASSSAPHISSSLGLFSVSSNHLTYVDTSHASASEFPEAQRHGSSMHACLPRDPPQWGPQASTPRGWVCVCHTAGT